MKPCCADPANLVAAYERPDLIVKTCTICGCRHFELTVDPIPLGVKGGTI